MIESSPRPIAGLGAVALGATVRPSWCPPAVSPADPCEIRYPVDIPIVGKEEVGIPVYRMVDDALEATTRWLPDYLPTLMSQVQPYVDSLQAGITEDMIETVEYEAPFLVEKLLEEQVMPRVGEITDEVIANAEGWRDEILTTLMAVGAASILSIGLAAWWINRKEVVRDKGGR